MVALGRKLSRTTINESEILEQLTLLCAAGLLISILMLIDGLDLSPGFF
jgi:hypothetical protein